ncbi:acyltransferase family protein [Vibrio sp. FNV 38]|nr:acyltransferase family protein [Vibrio sp. FNV 38]
MSHSSNKIASLELGRVIAIIAVIAIHSQLMTDYPLLNDQPWLGNLINQLSRFAVPFFFITSGYFLQPKLSSDPINTALRYCKPLLYIWLVWTIICLLMPFNLHVLSEQGWLVERSGYWNYLAQSPINSLLEGGLVHLWFLPSLIFAVAIIAIIEHINQSKWLVIFAVILYLYGVLAGSYQSLTEFSAPFFTRNGPFFSLLMVVIGYAIRLNTFSLTATQARTLLLFGLVGHIGEAYALTQFGIDFRVHDFLFSTPLWAAGVFLYLMAKPNLGNSPIIFSLANMTSGIYVTHLLIVIYMNNLTGSNGIEGPAKDSIVFLGTLIISVALTYGLHKSPLRKLFFGR